MFMTFLIYESKIILLMRGISKKTRILISTLLPTSILIIWWLCNFNPLQRKIHQEKNHLDKIKLNHSQINNIQNQSSELSLRINELKIKYEDLFESKEKFLTTISSKLAQCKINPKKLEPLKGSIEGKNKHLFQLKLENNLNKIKKFLAELSKKPIQINALDLRAGNENKIHLNLELEAKVIKK